MPDDVQVMRVGEATVTIINVGDLRADLGDWIPVPAHERPAHYGALFAQPLAVPVNCVCVSMPGATLLIDAGRYEAGAGPDSILPAYQPPPGLLARLGEAGITPDKVDHVVITHSHGDHFNGVTVQRGGHDEPCFPRARHYLGRPDWEQASLQDDLRDPTSLTSRTLGLLHQRGLLDLVEGDRDLLPGVRIIATPGESPGHQIVRLQSQGQTLYLLGDLYHHTVEVEQPDWAVHWADPVLTQRSRHAFVEAALPEHALLVATHIPGAGRLRRTPLGLTWEVLEGRMQ
ncbi:MAG: MBL fold metallo-hydrolase [Chloroflexota bacterium]